MVRQYRDKLCPQELFMSTIDSQAILVRQVLAKEKKLTGDDLQIFRHNTGGVPLLSSNIDYFHFRMEIELIDAIRSLDEASAKLITKTNALTLAILGLTVVGVALAGIQVWVAFRGSH
jgi:hypothetical protein